MLVGVSLALPWMRHSSYVVRSMVEALAIRLHLETDEADSLLESEPNAERARCGIARGEDHALGVVPRP